MNEVERYTWRRLDFYADGVNKKTGEVYKNRLFKFYINDPAEYYKMVVDTWYRFTKAGNKIRAMFLCNAYGGSLKLGIDEMKVIRTAYYENVKYQQSTKMIDELSKQLNQRK
jgi:hypothetical protein